MAKPIKNVVCPYCGFKNFNFLEEMHWCPICGYLEDSIKSIPSSKLIEGAIIANYFIEWIWSDEKLEYFQEYFSSMLWDQVLCEYLKKYGFKGLIYLIWEYK